MLNLSRPWRLGLHGSIIVLSVAALSMTHFLMISYHSPIKTQAYAAAQESIWAGVCGGQEDGTGGCGDVVTSDHGFIKLSWPTVTLEEHQDEQGQAHRKRTLRMMPMRIPIAQIGQVYYTFMLIWYLLIGVPAGRTRGWYLLPAVLSVGALVVSCYYLWVMAVDLNQWCPMCLLLHAVDLLLCVAAVMLWPRRSAAAEPAVAGQPVLVLPELRLRHVLATVLCVMVLARSSFVNRNYELQTAQALLKSSAAERLLATMQNDTGFLIGGFRHGDPVQIPPRDSAVSRGGPQAVHELVIFSDLQCPACRKFERELLEDILRLWNGRLRFTFRHYPLCPDCNPGSRINHAQACNAAYAVEAARLVGGAAAFWKMHDLILEQHDQMVGAGFEPGGFAKFAAEIGLDPSRFQEAFAGDAVRAVVEQDIAAAKLLNITGTPTAFVDGRRLTHYQLQTANLKFWQALAGQDLSDSGGQPGNGVHARFSPGH